MTLDYIDPIWAMQIKDTAVTTSITGKDIVARLRSTVYMDGSRGIEHDAADEIERLRGEVAELEEESRGRGVVAVEQLGEIDWRQDNYCSTGRCAGAAVVSDRQKAYVTGLIIGWFSAALAYFAAHAAMWQP